MAEIINLRRARKAKDRSERAATADANRLAFGRGKAERHDAARARAEADRHLDGHRRETTGDDA